MQHKDCVKKFIRSWREPNPYRLSARPSGYFRLFCLDGRQPTCAKESRKYLEKHIWQVPCSFAGADFCSGKAKLAENTAVLSRALTLHGRKSARQNRYVFDSRQLKLLSLDRVFAKTVDKRGNKAYDTYSKPHLGNRNWKERRSCIEQTL